MTPRGLRTRLVRRHSPDWASLAEAHRAGFTVDPAHYRPDPSTPGFPPNLVDLVALWNRALALDFFTCRAALKAISQANLDQVAGAMLSRVEDWRPSPPEAPAELVFFHDDDDGFAPELADVVAEIAAADFDVCVFPLVRLWTETVTFAHPGAPAPVIVGARSPFGFRYQSNNYGVYARRLDAVTFAAMREHMPASTCAEQRGFKDLYLNKTLGVTAKTPCSASLLYVLQQRQADPSGFVLDYVEALGRLEIPQPASWLRSSVTEIRALFAQAAGR